MSDDINIPREVMIAARHAYINGTGPSTLDDWEAAYKAGLKAWPGMRLGKYRDVVGPNDRIILPLPQEAGNEHV